MKTPLTDELREFHGFLGEKLKNGRADVSPEEALEEWRQGNPDSQTFEDDVAAIQEALDDLDKGDRGIPLEEFDREFRKQHHLPGMS